MIFFCNFQLDFIDNGKRAHVMAIVNKQLVSEVFSVSSKKKRKICFVGEETGMVKGFTAE